MDNSSDPALAEVVNELKAGKDITAAQLYCQVMGVGVGEGHTAVAELKQRLIL